MSTDAKTRASARYIALVDELGRELEHRYGWASEVARRLGVHQTMISMLHNRTRVSVGGEAVAKAIEALKLEPGYFYDTRPRPGGYRAYLREGAEPVGTVVDPVDDVTRGHVESVLAERAEEEDEETIEWLRGELEAMRWRGASRETVSWYAIDCLRQRRRDRRKSATELKPGEDGASGLRERQSPPAGMIAADRTRGGRKKGA